MGTITDKLSALFDNQEDIQYKANLHSAGVSEKLFHKSLRAWHASYAPNWTVEFGTGMGVGNVDVRRGPALFHVYFMPGRKDMCLETDRKSKGRGEYEWANQIPRQAVPLQELRAVIAPFAEWPPVVVPVVGIHHRASARQAPGLTLEFSKHHRERPMSRTIVKSFIYAPTKQRIVLHADFNKEEGLLGYSVRQIQGWGDHADVEEAETVEHFLVVDADSSSMAAYQRADKHFKDIVLPML